MEILKIKMADSTFSHSSLSWQTKRGDWNDVSNNLLFLYFIIMYILLWRVPQIDMTNYMVQQQLE